VDQLFNPKSVVVIGVSENPNNLARIIVQNLFEFNLMEKFFSLAKRKGFFLEGESVPPWRISEKGSM